MSYYNLALVIGIFLLTVTTILMIYLKRDFTRKIVKREDVLLGSVILLALWYMDILVLGMSQSGIRTTGGLVSVAGSQTYAIFLFIIGALGMIIIDVWWCFENEKINKDKKLRKWNRLFLSILTFGITLFMIAALSLSFRGPEILIWNQFTPFSLYHFSLSFIIFPTIAMMLEEKG